MQLDISLDALPYVDTEIGEEGMQAKVDALIAKEMRVLPATGIHRLPHELRGGRGEPKVASPPSPPIPRVLFRCCIGAVTEGRELLGAHRWAH